MVSGGGNGGTGGLGRTEGDGFTGKGGVGGQGGAGGDVQVNASYGLTITSAGGQAMLLASYGGAGGNGGEGNVNNSLYGSSRAGAGALGGEGGTVEFLSQADSSTITMEATNARALHLKSVGGDGGAGGYAESKGGHPERFPGTGGTGSNGGKVILDIAKNITHLSATGTDVEAILAESIGGDGGQPGTDDVGTAGEAGSAGSGGTVSLTLSSSTTTLKAPGSKAIEAQSIGGNVVNDTGKSPSSTGTGGNANTVTAGMAGTVTVNSMDGVYLISRGGNSLSSGNGGNGGDIYLDYDGTTPTTGSWDVTVTGTSHNYGFHLSSSGGEGHTGGDAGDIFVGSGASRKVTSDAANVTGFLAAATAGFGHSDGGDGGNATMAGTWDIDLTGSNTTGMTVISEGTSSAYTDVGQGGSIAFSEASTVEISSAGSGAGIESAGGNGQRGGNTGSVIVRGNWSVESVQDALSVKAVGGNASNAGAGGIAGTVIVAINAITGSANPMLSTTGDAEHGLNVLQQSGNNAPNNVSDDASVQVTIGGDITVTGASSHGIQAESTGNTRGAISVSVDSGVTVTGGAAAQSGSSLPDGAAVHVINGSSANSLTNDGTLTSASGTAVIYSGSGSLSINNKGTINGKIVGASSSVGSAELINGSSGTVMAGTQIEADVRNSGLFVGSSSGSGTTVSGDFVQSSSGTLLAPLTSDGSVPVAIEDAAEMNGEMGVTLANAGALSQLAANQGSFEVLTAADGVTLGTTASAKPSAVARYDLRQTDANTVSVGYDIDFANDDILDATNNNQDMLVRHLQDLWEDGSLTEEAGDGTVALLSVETASNFAEAANSLSAEAYADTQLTTLFAAQSFGDDMMSCAERSGAERFIAEGQCAWLLIGGERFNQDANDQSTGFDQNTFVLAGGAQYEVAPDTHLGLALSYRDSSLDLNHASADGQQYLLGIAAKRQFGPALLAASLSGSTGDFDVRRDLQTGDRSDGSQDVHSISGQLRGEYTLVRNGWYIKPRLDLAVDRIETGSLQESDAGGFDLNVSSGGETYVSVQPQVEFGGDVRLENGTLIRPMLVVGLTQFLTDTAPSVQAGLTASGAGNGFTSEAELDRTRFDLAAAVEVFATERLSLRADAFTSLSDNSQIYGGGIKFEFTF